MKPASETFELTETAAPDRLGSVVTLYRHNPLRETDPNSIVDRYTYDAYGNVSLDDIDNWYNGNQYMFTGRRYDSESGLYYYRARMYNPELGIFQSQDPMGYIDSMNLYAYCANNPLNFTDPMGEWTITIGFTFTIGFCGDATIGIGVAFDDNGNIGVYKYNGGGVTTPNVSIGVEGGWTNADKICDLNGMSYQMGGGLGPWGTEIVSNNPAAFGDASDAPPENVVTGFTVGYGFSTAPFESHITGTNTTVTPVTPNRGVK